MRSQFYCGHAVERARFVCIAAGPIDETHTQKGASCSQKNFSKLMPRTDFSSYANILARRKAISDELNTHQQKRLDWPSKIRSKFEPNDRRRVKMTYSNTHPSAISHHDLTCVVAAAAATTISRWHSYKFQ